MNDFINKWPDTFLCFLAFAFIAFLTAMLKADPGKTLNANIAAFFDKFRSTRTIWVIPSVICGLFLCAIYSDMRNRTANNRNQFNQEAVLNAITPLLDQCKSIGEKPFTVHRKCLIIAPKVSNPDDIAGRDVQLDVPVAPALKADWSDPEFTLFYITVREVIIDRYSATRQAAVRRDADVYVFYWPEKRPAAFHTIIGKNPPASRTITPFNAGTKVQSPEYGDIGTPIAEWISGLPVGE